MAFLICYSSTVEDHPREKAAYLPQSFYEWIVKVCRADEDRFPRLRQIASLRYKSPTLLLTPRELPLLVKELQHLNSDDTGALDFMAAATEAIARPCSLTISGDMYPELS